MPKSRSRKKADYIPPPERTDKSQAVSGRWVAPTMVTLLLIGLAWVVLYYVAAEHHRLRQHPRRLEHRSSGSASCSPA